MDHHITHPTKEQVRAYMTARESTHRPPPPPDEIRRQLGWSLEPDHPEHLLLKFFLLPSTCSHLAAQVALDWYFAAVRSPSGSAGEQRTR